MVSKLGNSMANQKIEQHTGVFGTDGELQQQKLDNYFG